MIFDIKKFAIHDGPGIRTTVFFKDCPLDCAWCHNPECKSDGAGLHAGLSRQELFDEVFKEIKKDRIFYEQSGGGATFSGGEPLLQIGLLGDLLAACKKAGIHTAVDTCGHVDYRDFEAISDRVDLFLYDLKLMDDEVHRKYTGASNRLILENLDKLITAGTDIRVRVPLIPGITDSDENLNGIADYVASPGNARPVNLLPYNLFGRSKYKKLGKSNPLGDLQTQSEDELKRMSRIFTARGIDVSY